MADEDDNEDGKKKKPLLKIILVVLLVLLLIVGAVAGTLFATGFFDAADKKAAEDKLQKLESQAEAAKGAAPGASGPKLVTKQSPELTRFQHTYLELERDLLANLTASSKVMQVQLALMTRYDERVFKNVKKHEFALRSVALDVMRQTRDAELEQPDFRKKLAEKIRTELNATLEKLEDFGGIEEVHFTSFVVQ